MKEMGIVKALFGLNKQTVTWLSFFLEAYDALERRKTYLRLFLQLEISQRDFLRENTLLQDLLANMDNKPIVEAVTKVIDASYPLFAEEEVLKMKAHSPSASGFPSIELYSGAVKTLQEAILAVKEALIESVESFITRSSTVAVMLHEGCKTSDDDIFTDKDLADSIDSDRRTESHAIMVIASYFDPHIERLEGLLIRAEKIKDKNALP